MAAKVIAVDAMGGDKGCAIVVPAALRVLGRHSDLTLVLVGDETALKSELSKHNIINHPRLQVLHSTEVVTMTDSAAVALRQKRKSSMRLAINLVKEGEADACVSAGNTGALMATARFVLKTLPGVDRPAIIANLPTNKYSQDTYVLDLGANVDSSPEHLEQFAIMGSVLAEFVGGITKPRIALLNIGEEDIKGNELVKQTAELLESRSELNYVGFVEGDDIYKGSADVIVCDGFVGNVALKCSEGIAKMIAGFLKEAFTANVFSKLAAVVAMPVLKSIAKRIDPARYNGACFIGLRGTVIKSHGSANEDAFTHALLTAVEHVENAIPDKIAGHVASHLEAKDC